MTKYLEKSFSVHVGGDQNYRDRWDAIFNKLKTQLNQCICNPMYSKNCDYCRKINDILTGKNETG